MIRLLYMSFEHHDKMDFLVPGRVLVFQENKIIPIRSLYMEDLIHPLHIFGRYFAFPSDEISSIFGQMIS